MPASTRSRHCANHGDQTARRRDGPCVCRGSCPIVLGVILLSLMLVIPLAATACEDFIPVAGPARQVQPQPDENPKALQPQELDEVTEVDRDDQHREETQVADTDVDSGTVAVEPVKPTASPVEGDWTEAAISNLAVAYTRVQGVWTGFEPNDHPALVVLRTDDEEIDSALAINFPTPHELGDAAELSADDTPFRSLHRLNRVDTNVARVLSTVEHFGFNIYLKGVDAFVIVAREGHFFADPDQPDFGAYFIHELFHRHQHTAFRETGGFRNLESYPLTTQNIELSTLEDRALYEAITTSDVEAREQAARRFAGIRIIRHAADYRLAVENGYEISEGTARYMEHRLGGSDWQYRLHDGNYEGDLFLSPILPCCLTVKFYYSFARFYTTGAVILHLLDLLEVGGVHPAVESGRSPAEILIGHLGVTESDVERLLADARQAYDPEGTLAADAERAAEQAKDDPPVFKSEECAEQAVVPLSGDGDRPRAETTQSLLVPPGGLEPPAYGLEVRRSVRLSYGGSALRAARLVVGGAPLVQ